MKEKTTDKLKRLPDKELAFMFAQLIAWIFVLYFQMILVFMVMDWIKDKFF